MGLDHAWEPRRRRAGAAGGGVRPAPGLGCTSQVRPRLPVRPALQGPRNKGGRRLAEAPGRGRCGLPREEAQEGDRE